MERRAATEARVSQVVGKHERSLMRVALHWSLCRDDALDAYQRALEIYVRRLESLDPATEISWLKVVVKHEALAVRRQRADALPVEEEDLDGRAADTQRPVDELLVARERVDRSAEALRRLKPDEAKALVLKAQGLSYREIGESLGWTYTKVNRCITEGRARFLKVYAEIEAGAECERFAPTLAALAGGTATADALLELRPHIRNCPACRATVRRLHANRLGRLAALWPVPVLLAPLRWVRGRFTDPDQVDAPRPSDPRPARAHPDLYDAIAGAEPPAPVAGRLVDAKAELYAFWHRLQGSDVATSAQLAAGAGGGGRIATIGAIVGLCLSSVGAGTVCVVTRRDRQPVEPGNQARAPGSARLEARTSGARRHAPPPRRRARGHADRDSGAAACRAAPAGARRRTRGRQGRTGDTPHPRIAAPGARSERRLPGLHGRGRGPGHTHTPSPSAGQRRR